MTDSQPIRAAAWMIGAIASFTAMAIAGRAVSHELDTFEIMLFRSIIGVIVVVLIGTLTGTIKQVQRTRLPLHAMRNLTWKMFPI